MNLCTVCLHTVPQELLRCPFCDSTLNAEGVEEVNEEFTWTILRTVSTEIEATLIAGRLRAHGVPAFVLSQVDSTRHFTVGALAVAKVFVPESMQAQAEEIMARPPDPFPEEGNGEGLTDTNH
jgi:hypothetical protein